MRTKRLGTTKAAAAAAAALVAGMTSGYTAARAESGPTIGVAVYDMISWPAWGQKGVQSVAAANHVNLLWSSAGGDVNTQISQIQQFINRKVDLIVVAAVNAATLGPTLEAARKAGIPVIAANERIDPPANQLLTAYVGPDDILAGRTETKYVAEALHGKGQVVVIQGLIGMSAETDRTAGIKQELAKYPDIKVLAMQPGNWDRTQAYHLMQDWLSRYGDQIQGVIAENDDLAVGAVQALRERNLNGKVFVTGIDGIKDAMRAVRAGDMLETNLQDAAIELGEATQVGIDYLQKRPYPKDVNFKMLDVTKDNVDRYYDQLYVKPDDFLKRVPELVQKNLKSGDYAAE